jgi:GNAT superfamily N-acetyltransferase
MEYKILSNTSVKDIHEAFLDAFSDYEVPIQMPFEKFQEMMKIRDLNPEFSIGCFDAEKLVGFIICGYREINGVKYCYDGGTGVIKFYRRKGIGEKMLVELIRVLKKKHIDRFILEVLENNTPAIKLYEKHGFKKTRKLECFKISTKLLVEPKFPEVKITNDISLLERLNENRFSLYSPTWQNDFRSVKNALENFSVSVLATNNCIIAFGIVHKTKGDIAQVGILEEWKNKGLETMIFAGLAQQIIGNELIILNVEEKNYLVEKLQENGFEKTVNQFEMKLDFQVLKTTK